MDYKPFRSIEPEFTHFLVRRSLEHLFGPEGVDERIASFRNVIDPNRRRPSRGFRKHIRRQKAEARR